MRHGSHAGQCYRAIVGWRSGSIAVAVLLVSAGASSRAHAQSVADAVPRHPVEFQASGPDVSIGVTGVAVDLPCGQRCVLELPEGRYRVLATRPGGVRSAEFLVVSGPSHVTVTPHNRAARITGFVLMPAGAGTAAAGVVLLWWAGFKWVMLRLAGCGGNCYDRETSDIFWPGGAYALGAGAVIGLTGVAIWRLNAHADLDVTPLAQRPVRDRGPRLARAGRGWR
jgi:hypothetical protein